MFVCRLGNKGTGIYKKREKSKTLKGARKRREEKNDKKFLNLPIKMYIKDYLHVQASESMLILFPKECKTNTRISRP